jgi:release factor glutamine methyltransferase
MNQEIKWLLRDKYSGVESTEFQFDINRILGGEPLGYVIGWVPFLNTKIYLDSKPLIPRAETEYWVSQAITEIKAMKIKEPKILDLCAGSGCIGVAVLKEIPEARVDFVEIDSSHHMTIKKNLEENGLLVSQSRIFGGDLFENIEDKYDVILSNPPYIDPELSYRVHASVKQYEPQKALYGGDDGMEILRRILSEVPKHLYLNGSLYIEHEPEQAEKIAALLPDIKSYKDQFGVIRFSIYKKS